MNATRTPRPSDTDPATPAQLATISKLVIERNTAANQAPANVDATIWAWHDRAGVTRGEAREAITWLLAQPHRPTI